MKWNVYDRGVFVASLTANDRRQAIRLAIMLYGELSTVVSHDYIVRLDPLKKDYSVPKGICQGT